MTRYPTSFSLLLALLLLIGTCAGQSGLSSKGRKFNSLGAAVAPATTTEDPFYSFDLDSSVPEVDDDDENLFDDFDFDEDFVSFGEDDLPPCYELSEDDLALGVSCDNSTAAPEPEIRHRDPLFERLLAQIWSDYQTKLNEEASLYGFVVDPLDVDAQLPETTDETGTGGGGGGINIKQKGTGYSADVGMRGIKVYGLSGINMSENVVTRSENLTDIDLKITFAFDQLIINGSYSPKGYVGFWGVDSQGEQNFEIKIQKADLTYGTKMELVDPDSDWANQRGCANRDDDFLSMSDSDQPDVIITEISLPLTYAHVDFRFDNLGAFANNMVNGIGMYILQTQEEVIVGEIRKAIKTHVNSLIC